MMELTPERLECLKIVATSGVCMSHDDPKLSPFSDDKSTLTKPDVFNQCHNAGWLISRHDDRTDTSFVFLTKEGRATLSMQTGDHK